MKEIFDKKIEDLEREINLLLSVSSRLKKQVTAFKVDNDERSMEPTQKDRDNVINACKAQCVSFDSSWLDSAKKILAFIDEQTDRIKKLEKSNETLDKMILTIVDASPVALSGREIYDHIRCGSPGSYMNVFTSGEVAHRIWMLSRAGMLMIRPDLKIVRSHQEKVTCQTCKGEGKTLGDCLDSPNIWYEPCNVCKGTGSLECMFNDS